MRGGSRLLSLQVERGAELDEGHAPRHLRRHGYRRGPGRRHCCEVSVKAIAWERDNSRTFSIRLEKSPRVFLFPVVARGQKEQAYDVVNRIGRAVVKVVALFVALAFVAVLPVMSPTA